MKHLKVNSDATPEVGDILLYFELYRETDSRFTVVSVEDARFTVKSNEGVSFTAEWPYKWNCASAYFYYCPLALFNKDLRSILNESD